MPTADLRAITDFESLRDFLEDELDWNLLWQNMSAKTPRQGQFTKPS
jgi:hypothetical protein